jgi:S-adenosylmethionine:tRNA ribosyltransferase-isomerase
MRLEDLDYDLPADRIAQHPTARREASRLLVVERASGRLSDSHFERLGEWLRPGDALALNETRVIPARLEVRRATGGRVELLFVRPEADGAWRVLARPARLMRTKDRLATEDGSLEIEVTGAGDEGERLVRVTHGDLQATLAERGEMPLPPYLRRGAEPQDRERYQTVFARVDGAVAAPTAGLHFSGELLGKLEAIGIATARIVLHVGPGTFRPVTAADPRDHRMDEEWFEVDASAAATLNGARARGGRIVAVGTTAVRALESACDANDGALAAAGGWTRKYIHPPYAFRAVDAMVTNFHLPRTTLLLLVAAFAGVETTRRAYAHALDAGYRFYSYGDAMLIL